MEKDVTVTHCPNCKSYTNHIRTDFGKKCLKCGYTISTGFTPFHNDEVLKKLKLSLEKK